MNWLSWAGQGARLGAGMGHVHNGFITFGFDLVIGVKGHDL